MSRFKEDIQTPAGQDQKNEMGETPTKPEEQKVTNERAGWKTPLLLTLCLLQAANALKGPRLVSGEPGGAVTVTCHYAPTSVNRHQRKYWCRLGPPKWICRTIVSTNYYTHLRYHGRVTLEDFPRSSLFVVRLFQLSPTDEGCYRCGIGSRNDMLFFSVNLTVSTVPIGLSSTVPTGTQAASELTRASLATTSPEANRWTSGTIQTGEGQRAGWDRVDPTPGTSETTASSKDRQPPEITMPVTPGTGSRVDVSVSATVPSPKFTVLSNTTDDIWVPGTRSSTANRAMVSEEGGRTMTPNTDGPIEETTSIRVALDATWKAVGTIRPSALTSKKWVWETFQEETSVSKPPALGDLEDATPAAGAWTFGTIIQEMATAEGSTKGDLVSTAEDSGLHATPSQATGVEPLRPRGTESSTERPLPEKESLSRILTLVSGVLSSVVLLVLALLPGKLWRKQAAQKTPRAPQVTLIQMTPILDSCFSPAQLPPLERTILQDASSPTHARLPVLERDPGF